MQDTWWLEVVIQLCRLQIQREREKLAMTPKMRGALESLKKLQHFGDEEAERLTNRIENEVKPRLIKGFERAHSSVDDMNSVVDGIDDFAKGLVGDNGAPNESGQFLPDGPRSSEVANK